MRHTVRKIMSGADNETPDIARILGAVAVAVFLGLSVYSVCWQKAEWKPADFGTGLGLVFVAIGGFIKLKEKSEPAVHSGDNDGNS